MDEPSSSSSFRRATRVDFGLDTGRGVTIVAVKYNVRNIERTSLEEE